ncbi:MAG: zinc ABC transporter permease AztB [Actinobacteria bacterium]|nr:zinc ABC transporter permease AztB [Actinomycetota bacterium]
MAWLTDPFHYDFILRALFAGCLAAVTCSLIGTWVVIRGMSFMGDALAHGVLPGIAVAFIVGIDIAIGAFVSAIIMVIGINLVNRASKLSTDTGIGLLFVGMLALGVVIISRTRSFTGDLTSFLFGSVLGVKDSDIWLQSIAAVLTLIAVIGFHRMFLALSFNSDKAATLGMRPRLAHIAMLTLIAVAIVASFRTVGTLLVFGLLIAPPATAALLVRRVPAMMATACAIGVSSIFIGLIITYHFDTAAGATMAGTAVAIFFIVLAGRELFSRIGRTAQPAHA